MLSIYVLQLEQNKYYVGKSTNPQFRLEQHFNANGSAWTTRYKPQSVIELIPDCDDFDEDKLTLKYMAKYGISNVRGGSFCELELSENDKITIQKMLKGSQDLCFVCGGDDHFARECKYIMIEVEQITYEHQRWYPFTGWSSNLLPTDRPRFSSKDGSKELRKESFVLQPNQQIIRDWSIDTEGSANTEGWYYAFVFQDPTYNLKCESDNFVRRRKWIRVIKSITLKQPKQLKIHDNEINQPDQNTNSAIKYPEILGDALNFMAEHLVNHLEDKLADQETCTKNKSNVKCFRCGRYGHLKADCYAKTHVDKNKKL